MAVLRMLFSFLGSEGFRKGLQTYVRKYMFENAKMSELWQTFSEVGIIARYVSSSNVLRINYIFKSTKPWCKIKSIFVMAAGSLNI